MPNSMHKKLIGIFLALTVIPIIIFSVLMYTKIYNVVKDKMIYATLKEMKQIDNAIDIYFKSIEENCEMLASSDIVKSADTTLTKYDHNEESVWMTPSINGGIEQKIYEYFNEFAKSHPKNAYVYMATEDGGYIQWPEGKIMEHYDPRKRPFYIAALESNKLTVRTEPYYFPPDDFVDISVVTKILDENGKMKGIMGLDTSLEDLTKIISDIRIGENGYMILVDKNGKIMANPADPKTNFTELRKIDNIGLNHLAEVKSGYQEIEIDGRIYIAHVYTSSSTNWKYIAVIPHDEITRSLQDLGKNIATLLVITLIIVILLSIFMSKLIAKPVMGISGILDKMGKGDYSEKIPQKYLESPDEIGILAKTAKDIIITRRELENKIIELNSSREELKMSEEKYRLVTEATSDVIWTWDREHDLWSFSPRWFSIFGYDSNRDSFDHNKWLELLHPEDAEIAENAMRMYLEQKSSKYECVFRIRASDGSYKWIQARGMGIFDQDNNLIRMSGSHSDITEKEELSRRINTLLYYDQVTALPNRLFFWEWFEKQMYSALFHRKTIALYFVDIDNFKYINDSFGHVVGDLFLGKIAQRLNTICNVRSVLVRQGGDEFVYAFEVTKGEAEVKLIADRIVKLFDEPFEVQGTIRKISASVGAVYYPVHGLNIEDLLKKADIAMYEAKRQGKNKYQLFNMEMMSQLLRRLSIEQGLGSAITKNELLLYYQPQINFNEKRIIGFEALLRWESKELGLVSPSEVIPIAEETGMIVDIGMWTLRQALRKYKEIAGYLTDSFTMSVNVSAVQIQQINFAEQVKDLLEEEGVAPGKLELEITESVLIGSEAEVMNVLNNLKKIGIRLCLDDFGTGYSSLGYLKRLPIDTIKMDKAFIEDIYKDEKSKTLAYSIISMAQKLGLTVIAEGIETEEQLNCLGEINCEMVQGYYFSSSLPDGALIDFIVSYYKELKLNLNLN